MIFCSATYRLSLRIFSFIFYFLVFTYCTPTAFGQETVANQETYQITIRPVVGQVKLDGIPDEGFWQLADSATRFWMKSPLVKPGAAPLTVVRLGYDSVFLYVAAWCMEIAPVNVQTLRRDANYWRGDGIGIVLDPVNQHTFAYFFAVNPYGSQTDGLILGPNQSVTDTWDGRFYAEAQMHDGYWTAEMAIPLRSLRFSTDNKEWGVNFVRNVLNQNELHTWAPVPIQFGASDINYTGRLNWMAAPTQETSNIALIPYTLAGYQKEPNGEKHVQTRFTGGLDARIGLASSLNLDLTLNPDFSQAEIDEQPVNLTRFNLFLPERRPFFLENRDVFTSFGTSDMQPFFSRRIGLDENGRSIPILFGARLSGNVAPDTRIGVLNMQTLSEENNPAQNFSALAVHQQVLKRSIVRALISNRQEFAEGEFQKQSYGRNAGLETIYLREDGKLEAWAKYHHSFKPGVYTQNGMYASGFAYRSRNFSSYLEGSGAGPNFFADMGFLRRIENYDASLDTTIRIGFHQLNNELTYSFYPENHPLLNRHWATFSNSFVFNPDGTLNESSHNLSYTFFAKDRRYFQLYLNYNQVNLQFPTKFVQNGEALNPGYYNYVQGGVFFDTDSRRTWYFLTSLDVGQFYNGHILRARGGVTYRIQPYGSLGFSANWNNVRLPDAFGQTDILNITTRLDITFTRSLFWTTFFQYNTQAQIFNINSRFQWRFAPLSDLYLVYTDSYTAPSGALMDRTRTVVLKLNYWWTI